MHDDQLLRYSRHIMLPEIDLPGQEALLASRVLIVGLGGLGAPAALYLAASGVGHLALADADSVDASNLQRQIIHSNADIDQSKVASAAESVTALNPETAVTPLEQRLEGEALAEQVRAADLVLDCSDNFATRFAVNAACARARTPLVSGAAIRLEGQVAVFDARQSDTPCYRCLYHSHSEEDTSCAANGVLSPLVGVIGSMQAVEAIKLLAGFGRSLAGRLLLFDAGQAQWRELALKRDPDCPACGQR